MTSTDNRKDGNHIQNNHVRPRSLYTAHSYHGENDESNYSVNLILFFVYVGIISFYGNSFTILIECTYVKWGCGRFSLTGFKT